MCFYNDGDGCIEFQSDEIPRSRKDRKCECCFSQINRGELYQRISGKFEGDMFSLVYCGVCELHRYRIHIHELSEDCRWDESWCPHEELSDYLYWNPMEPSSRDDGQLYLARMKVRRKRTLEAVA